MAMPDLDPKIENPEAVQREWLERLEALVQDVKGWAEASGWRTRRIKKSVKEREFGRYEVPVLLMEKDTVQVVLNPVARFVPGADGAVDLYLSPAYDDIATLYLKGDRWFVYNAERPDPAAANSVAEPRPLPYGQETICSLLDRMSADA